MSQFLDLMAAERHGTRGAVYEALIGSIPSAGEYFVTERLLDALAVAGLGPRAAATLARYWPGEDHRPLFAHAREYLPRILTLASWSPYGRFRAVAVHALPPVGRKEFAEWGFDDTTMPLPQRAMIAAKLNEPELFGAMLAELQHRADDLQSGIYICTPPLCLDYMVGPAGPYLYSPCAGKGDRTRRIEAGELFAALAIPFDITDEEHCRQFQRIFHAWRDDQFDLHLPRTGEAPERGRITLATDRRPFLLSGESKILAPVPDRGPRYEIQIAVDPGGDCGVDYLPDCPPDGMVSFWEGHGPNGSGWSVDARAALTPASRKHLACAHAEWFIPVLERLAAGETIEMEALDRAHRTATGRALKVTIRPKA